MTTTWQWFPALHPALLALFALALCAALAYGSWLLSLKHLPRRSIVQLAALRVGMIVLLVLALFQPVLSVPRTVSDSPGLLVLVDASASMSSPAASGTRWDEVRQKLQQSSAVQTAGRNHPLHWFTFDRRSYPTTASGLDQAAASGDGTDLAASLKSAWNYVRLLNASHEIHATPTRALIVSDGQHRSSSDVVAVAKELGLALDVLVPSRTADQPAGSAAEIVLVQAGRRVLIGSETAFQATIRPHQIQQPLSLVVEEEGQEIARHDLPGLTAGQDHFLEIKTRPKEAGLKRYTFQLMQGETPVDQPYAVNVQIVDDRHDVLILEDAWRWEFKYLRRVLEDDPSFSLTALLARGQNAFVQFGEPDRRVKLGGFPQSRAELDGFDTLVLGDVRPGTWPRGLARHISAAVTEGGKSLVVVAGAHLSEWVDSPELSRLLPVELTRESGTPVPGHVDVKITPEGKADAWFTLTTKSGKAVETSAALPTLEHVYPVLRKRPAATVLLETVGNQNAYGPLVVAAEHTVGRGRVLFIATDTLWRWQSHGPRTDDGVTLHAAFWQHAFRALAPTEQTSGRRQVFLRPERTHFREGDAVRVSAEFSSDEQDVAAPTLEGTVTLPDGRRVPLGLQSDERLGGAALAQFEPSQTGRYRIEATARRDGQAIADSSVVIEVASRGNETDGSPVDAAALERWAAATGGRVIDADAADGWVAADARPAPTVIRRQSYDLWHNFSLLLLLCVLLAADWSLRLFRGYV